MAVMSQALAMLAVVVLVPVAAPKSAADPDIVTDFVVAKGTTLNSSFFTNTRLRTVITNPGKAAAPFVVTPVFDTQFPALEGQSVAIAALQFLPGGANGPHLHHRSTELLLVLSGWLEVGFINANNTLFTQYLQAGDVFVFPKGLLHFQVNKDTTWPALAVSAFGIENPSVVQASGALFKSGIEQALLAKFFNTDVQTIQNIVAANN